MILLHLIWFLGGLSNEFYHFIWRCMFLVICCSTLNGCAWLLMIYSILYGSGSCPNDFLYHVLWFWMALMSFVSFLGFSWIALNDVLYHFYGSGSLLNDFYITVYGLGGFCNLISYHSIRFVDGFY